MKILSVYLYLSLYLGLIGPQPSFANPSCQDAFRENSSSTPQIHHLFDRLHQMVQEALRKNDFRSPEEFHQAIRSSNPFRLEISNLIFSDEFEMAVATPQKVRNAIMKSNEFKNQYQTETSQGGVKGEWQVEKQELEAHLANTPIEEYKQWPAQLKPKYGFGFSRHPRLAHSKSALENIFSYGEDIFVFKKERIAHRTSIFIGDSWNEQLGRGADDLAKSIQNGRAIDQQFLPWDYRDLVVLSVSPYLNYFSTGGRFESTPDYQRYQEIGQGPTAKRIYRTSLGFISYLELQYWGALSLEDVKAFYFSKTLPRGAFLKKLKELGIEIYDFRGESPVPYQF